MILVIAFDSSWIYSRISCCCWCCWCFPCTNCFFAIIEHIIPHNSSLLGFLLASFDRSNILPASPNTDMAMVISRTEKPFHGHHLYSSTPNPGNNVNHPSLIKQALSLDARSNLLTKYPGYMVSCTDFVFLKPSWNHNRSCSGEKVESQSSRPLRPMTRNTMKVMIGSHIYSS